MCFFEKELWITLLSLGVQSANTKKRETDFRVIFLVIEEYFQENRVLNGSVKFIKEVFQEKCKKNSFQKKICSGKMFFMKIVFEWSSYQWGYRGAKTE